MKLGRGGLITLAMMLAAGCASVAAPEPVDIPVGTLGMPFDVDANSINSFVCANDKHFTIAYLSGGIYLSTGVGGVLPMQTSATTQGTRYDGGNFTVIASANRAVVYYDGHPAMWDCYSIMQ